MIGVNQLEKFLLEVVQYTNDNRGLGGGVAGGVSTFQQGVIRVLVPIDQGLMDTLEAENHNLSMRV